MLIIGQLFLIVSSVGGKEPAAEEGTEPPAAYEMKAPGNETGKTMEPIKVPAKPILALSSSSDESVTVLAISFPEESLGQTVEFDFSKQFKLTKLNHEGKFLRLKFQPALIPVGEKSREELQKKFRKFSSISGSGYSEWIFYGKGKIGKPYITRSSSNLPRLVIPFLEGDADFPLKGGTELESGLWHYTDRVFTKAGPTDVFLLRLEAMNSNLNVFPVLANEGICQKEILSSMGRRYQALAGINGAYFTNRGDPIGTLVINRKLISSPLYNRSVFGLSDRGIPLFGNPDFSGQVLCRNISLPSRDGGVPANRPDGDVLAGLDIDAVNQPRTGDKLVVYTPEFARSTMTREPGVELVLIKGRVVGIQKTDTLIPPDGVVISAGGIKSAAFLGIRLGDRVDLNYKINQSWDRILHAVCGGPRLVADGKVAITGRQEKFDNAIVNGRHPRSAVAVTNAGEILFVVADGRSGRSAGMLLNELAEYLKKLGAKNAINLDGGGSSSMLVDNKIVNRPSDGKERPISNGILISKK